MCQVCAFWREDAVLQTGEGVAGQASKNVYVYFFKRTLFLFLFLGNKKGRRGLKKARLLVFLRNSKLRLQIFNLSIRFARTFE